MNPALAIVGMSCVYPDAKSPGELWDNVMAQRRAFRRIPAERLRLDDYFSTDRNAPDTTYATEAACIEGYEFDRVSFRVAGSTYRSADLAHWLALDVASQALADAGFRNGEGLRRETTGVVLGNTLTGEFSRANVMRLRWPYVRRVLDAALAERDWSAARRREFLEQVEQDYKAPFPAVGEESLAGGLSNTIAGRICNQFDLKGGGYTVDGACAASLLAVANACNALTLGDIDVALAGGVDLSLDPFEIVGFAKTGALAPELMRIYDARSSGFWPGEGCGFVVLMRLEDALAQCRRVYAVVRGWGVSSDGSGGITRPEVDGQIQALRRAYRRAGYGIDSVEYFEGHGTGTSVGDDTELKVISRARREARNDASAAAIGSIKANIGHTKAAAGMAGFIKATLAVHHQILPPTTGCETPHAELRSEAPALRVLREPEAWPAGRELRAAVSAMGFGGINTHVTIESPAADRRSRLGNRERALGATPQDGELFLFSAVDAASLVEQIDQLMKFAAKVSRAELMDLAAELERRLTAGPVRAAIVASTPAELGARLAKLKQLAEQSGALSLSSSGEGRGQEAVIDAKSGIFFATGNESPRIGFLFPGQGSPANLGGGIYTRRFEFARDLYAEAELPASGDGVSTEIAQPAIVTASLAGLKALKELGVSGTIAVGHSLGEITALHWAGAFDEEALVRIARVRGRAMAELGAPTGTMAAIAAPADEVRKLIAVAPVFIVGLNSPHQTVVAGESDAIEVVLARARTRGIGSTSLRVSHAFHTPLVAAAAPVLGIQLAQENVRPVHSKVASTVTGELLTPGADLRELLTRQVTSPVRFIDALEAAADEIDLWIEVGPGKTLGGLASDCQSRPVISLDAAGESIKGLLLAVGAAYALGASVKHAAVFRGRFTRPFNLNWQPKFFTNPCELAPIDDEASALRTATGSASPPEEERGPMQRNGNHRNGNGHVESARVGARNSLPPVELVRGLVAHRSELPIAAVKDDSRMLSDLHLNSISVGQLIGEAARQLGLQPLVGVNEFANATVSQIADALTELSRRDNASGSRTEIKPQMPPGVDSWIRAFTVDWVDQPLRRGRDAALRRPSVSALSDDEGGRRSAASLPALSSNWRVIAPPDHPLTVPVHRLLAQAGGTGVVVCLPPEPDLNRLLQNSGCLAAEGGRAGLLMEGARTVLALGKDARFVLVQQPGWTSSSFARSLHLESPGTPTCVVDLPFDHPRAAEWIRDEALATTSGYSEARYDVSGKRSVPRFKHQPLNEPSADLLPGPEDVLLVTGGGKGITAESALALARKTGVRLALLGRSKPESDSELAAHLERLKASRVTYRYYSVDVIDAEAVRTTVASAEAELGKITGVLHGAGTNKPKSLGALDEAAFRETLAPKLLGLRNVLVSINPAQLRWLITYGSIISRIGLHGEADYAIANEWQTILTERFHDAFPHCRCLAIEWSVWSQLGMGARLGRIESLMQAGVTPIPPDQGVEFLQRLLGQKNAGTTIITGRFGQPPTVRFAAPDLPFARFVETPQTHVPGVELIVDVAVSSETDPYVEDHVYHGERLFPAVMGLEAMAQVAMTLTESSEPPSFEQVKLQRPVIVPRDRPVTIRVAALVREPGVVEVVLRSEESNFQADHFRAVCRFEERVARIADSPIEIPNQAPDSPSPSSGHRAGVRRQSGDAARLAFDPAPDIYSTLLFHSGRFQRIQAYRRLRAKECLAEITPTPSSNWFGRYLPQELALGDAGIRDAAIHSIQACIPHARLLPTGVDRIIPGAAAAQLRSENAGTVLVHAIERSREGQSFHYDMEILAQDGSLIERWEGLHLRMVEPLKAPQRWREPLLSVYLERRVEELMPSALLSVALTNGSADRRLRADHAIQMALGGSASIHRRADGKPEAVVHSLAHSLFPLGEERPQEAPAHISAAHSGCLTLAVASERPAGCDMEAVQPRSAETWQDLLGPERFQLAGLIARESAEDSDAAATRIWVARECLKKAGSALDAPLTIFETRPDGWVLLSSGMLRIATYIAPVGSPENRLAVGFLGATQA